MSLTTSSGQGTGSLPLPTPLPTEPEHQNSSSSGSLLFTFLVLFLTIFSVSVVGGVVFHHIMFRRRQILRVQLERISQRQLKKQQPTMWDMWTAPSQFLEAKGQWKDLNPLSVQVDVSSPNSCIPADESLPRLQPMSVRLAFRLAQDTLLRRPIAPAPPSITAADTLPSPAPVVPTPGTEVQVAVLVAMPSAQNRHRSPLGLDMRKGEEKLEELGLGEYVIGTAWTHIGPQDR